MELRLYLNPDAPLSFVEPLTLPADAPDGRPWLMSVGDLALHARTGTYKGTFINDNPSVSVELDNAARQASTLLRQPLRALAELWDGDMLYFRGLVQKLTYGTTLDVEIGS